MPNGYADEAWYTFAHASAWTEWRDQRDSLLELRVQTSPFSSDDCDPMLCNALSASTALRQQSPLRSRLRTEVKFIYGRGTFAVSPAVVKTSAKIGTQEMLEIQPVDGVISGPGDPALLVVDGEEVIAHVYRPEYAPVFCASPNMLALLEVFVDRPQAQDGGDVDEAVDEARYLLHGVKQQQDDLESTSDATVTIMDGFDLIAYLHKPAYAPVLAAGFKMLELLQTITTARANLNDPAFQRAVQEARELEVAVRVQQSAVAHTRGATIH